MHLQLAMTLSLEKRRTVQKSRDNWILVHNLASVFKTLVTRPNSLLFDSYPQLKSLQ